MKRRHPPAEDADEDAAPPDLAVRPMDRRRVREIRQWLEGSRPDSPTQEELRDFLAWVAQEIEWHLARHQSIEDLLVLLNAARAELGGAGDPDTRG